jgi:hypothetical protein
VRAGIAALEASIEFRQFPDTKLETVLIEQWRIMPLQRQRERIVAVLGRAIVNPTHQRGPTFDHRRVELVWRTETSPTTTHP